MKKSSKKKMTILFIAILLSLGGVGYYHSTKTLPQGINYKSEKITLDQDSVKFLYDLTYQNKDGKTTHEQTIFNRIFELIENSEKYILLDMFLFNSFEGNNLEKPFRQLSKELTEKLINQKTKHPELKIDFITDNINTVYNGSKNWQINALKEAGVNIIITNTNKLRDSNPIYSSIWRSAFQWFKNNNNGGHIKHPFSISEDKVSIKSYLSMLNFKANHRKIFLADNNNDVISIITSANPHDGSSAHSNVALEIKGDFWKQLYNSEKAIAKLSNSSLQNPELPLKGYKLDLETPDETLTAQLLTEEKIKKAIIELLENTRTGDTISVAMFYLSEKEIINALIKASQIPGVTINIILDPNKDAFGFKKNGIPNRQSSQELLTRSKNNIKIKWYNTQGEQFHTKMISLKSVTSTTLILGSANFTRRNLNNYNLETNVLVSGSNQAPIFKYMETYYQKIWNNKDQNKYTLEYSSYEDKSELKKIIYKLQEELGLSSF